MKLNVDSMKQQTQDFVLRLFVGAELGSLSSHSSYYTCARCVTHERLYR